MQSSVESAHQVIVIGGGYAGVMAANRLRSSLTPSEAARVSILMISPTDQFVERIRLHQVAAGSIATACRPLRDILHADVGLQPGTVTAIRADSREIDVATPAGRDSLPYDSLVYAVGSAAATTTPGVAEHAYQLASPDAALRARSALAQLTPGQRVVVVGGGLTGIEAASEIAERHPHTSVTVLSSGELAQAMRPAAQRDIRRSLTRLGVTVAEGSRVDRVEAGKLILADQTTMPFDVCIWAASFAVPQLAADSGLTTDEAGRMLVDESLRSVDSPSILGAGDAVRTPDAVGAHLRMSCAAALPMGGAAADTVLARIRGQEPRPISIGFLLQCISLGRKGAYVQVVTADDTPRTLYFGGRVAARIKEAICRLSVAGPLGERSKAGSYRSPRGPRIRAADPARTRAGSGVPQ